MTDRPIIFSGPMVRALLGGTKTQTLRVLKPQPLKGETVIERDAGFVVGMFRDSENAWRDCRVLYQPGDRLYVREAWAPLDALTHDDPGASALAARGFYRADQSTVQGEIDRWRPSIHMPRWASRITLVVTDVKVERVQDISEADAIAEGIDGSHSDSGPCKWQHPKEDYGTSDPRHAFCWLWDSLNAKRGYGWDANPWVVAITFTVQRGNIDSLERTP